MVIGAASGQNDPEPRLGSDGSKHGFAGCQFVPFLRAGLHRWGPKPPSYDEVSAPTPTDPGVSTTTSRSAAGAFIDRSDPIAGAPGSALRVTARMQSRSVVAALVVAALVVAALVVAALVVAALVVAAAFGAAGCGDDAAAPPPPVAATATAESADATTRRTARTRHGWCARVRAPA